MLQTHQREIKGYVTIAYQDFSVHVIEDLGYMGMQKSEATKNSTTRNQPAFSFKTIGPIYF